jgi:hypothetical protein
MGLEVRFEHGVTLAQDDKEQCVEVSSELLLLSEIGLDRFLKKFLVKNGCCPIRAGGSGLAIWHGDAWGDSGRVEKGRELGGAWVLGGGVELEPFDGSGILRGTSIHFKHKTVKLSSGTTETGWGGSSAATCLGCLLISRLSRFCARGGGGGVPVGLLVGC